MTDTTPARNYLAELDGVGRHQVNTFLDEVEDVASRLEQSAAAIRQQASRVEIIRLDGSLATKDGETVLPCLTMGDLLPDMGRLADRTLHEIMSMMSNLRLDAMTQKGRDAHEAFRRAQRDPRPEPDEDDQD